MLAEAACAWAEFEKAAASRRLATTPPMRLGRARGYFVRMLRLELGGGANGENLQKAAFQVLKRVFNIGEKRGRTLSAPMKQSSS
jgi:hypothetical protein